MRLIRLPVLALVLIAIVLVAVANRESVSIKLMPPGLDSIWQWSTELPLFVVILLSILTGVLLGYVLEWVRERKHRRVAATQKREVNRLEHEIIELRRKSGEEKDEILSILN